MFAALDGLRQLNHKIHGDRIKRGEKVRVAGRRSSDLPAEKLSFCSGVTLQALGLLTGKHGGFVGRDDFMRGAVLADGGGVNPHDAMAEAADLVELVRDQDHRAPRTRYVAHFPQAFLLKIDVAHGENFIHQQNFGLQMRRHCKRQPHVHSGRVVLDGRVDEFFQFGERHDFIEFPFDLRFAHPQDRSGKERVFASGQFRMKPCPHFQQRADPPVNLGPAFRRPRDAGQNLQQRRLARPIPPD